MIVSKVNEVIVADRRLVILRLLVEYRGALNSSALESGLRPYHSYIDRAMVRDDLRWLELRDLVALEDLGRDVLDVRVTPKGERAADGKEWVEGVARPSKG